MSQSVIIPTSKIVSAPHNIKGDNRPSDYEYAVIAQHIYRKDTREGSLLDIQPGNHIWKVIFIRKGACGYFGAIYINEPKKQIVVAHRGTNSYKDILEDICGIFLNKSSPQKGEALYVIKKAVDFIGDHPEYHLSSTGHSLGAFLAEFSIYFVVNHFPALKNVNAVTFESPGSYQAIQPLTPVRPDYVPPKLDIISYVCYPNLINTCHAHIGTMYMISVDLGRLGWWPVHSLLKTHSSAGIKEWFERAITGSSTCKERYYMSDWPKGFFQKNVFYKYTDFENGRYTIIRDIKKVLSRRGKPCSKEAEDVDSMKGHVKKFKLKYNGNFHIYDSLSPYNVIPIQHFFPAFQQFLREFHAKMIIALSVNDKSCKRRMKEFLGQTWKQLAIPRSVIDCLLHLKIIADKIGVEEVDVGDGNIVTQFRQEFSNWLEQNPNISVEDLVPSHLKLFFNFLNSNPKGDYINSSAMTEKAVLKVRYSMPDITSTVPVT